jgi:hypothetical protein
MANSDKNIVITPNIGSTTADPQVVFSGASSTLGPQNITLQVYPTNNGTLSFEGSAGQLFSITNSLTGTIFSVNDVSGIPSIEVLDIGLVKIAQYSGRVLIGTGTDNGVDRLQVSGDVLATSFKGNATTATSAATLTTARTIGGVSFNGSANIDLPGVNTAGNQNTTGSAATLTTTRTIWGQNFNGGANVTGALTGVTTLSMNNQLTNTLAIGTAPFAITSTTRVSNLNVATAGTADTWTTGRTLTIGSTGKSVNGSGNVAWSLAEIGAAASTATVNLTGDQSIAGVKTFSGTLNWGNAGTRVYTKDDAGAIASKSGFFESSVPVNYYTGASSWQHLIESRHSNDGNNYAMQIAGSFFDQTIWFRKTNNSATTAWTQFLTTSFCAVTGSITATGDITAYFSDARLKTFEGTIPNALDKVLSLNGYYFYENELAKSLGYNNDNRQVGVSAQEVQKIMPEVVTTAPISDEYLTVKYEKLVPLLIEAIKEQQTIIENQNQRLSNLERLVNNTGSRN